MKRLVGREGCRIVVAMSGGVDSSVVAGLLAERGYEVIGVTMKLYDNSDSPDSEGSCCSLDDVSDARRVAEHLGIPFYVGNHQEVFQKAVVNNFVETYLAGETPNPCVRCNDIVKFRSLLGRAKALGADFLATGHYARTVIDDHGVVSLHEGVDETKDQTYFLAGIGQRSLQRVLFPLGELTKAEVRAEATRLGLPVATKPESQEICFIPDNDYAGFVERVAGQRLGTPGNMVSLDGLRLGAHRGLHHYTVGQRRGLRLAGPERNYVVALRPETNELVVGGKQDVLASGLRAGSVSWLGPPPADGSVVRARIRHRHRGQDGQLRVLEESRVEVLFDAPVAAVSPGQQLALYHGDRVLGSATIERSIPCTSGSHAVSS